MVRSFGVTFFAGMFAVLGLLSGCSKAPSPSQADANPAAAPGNSVTAQGPVEISTAMATVSQFLDAVRRGGDTGGAHSLLTKQAGEVLQRLGRTVQPIGSPDATFSVTRSEAVPEHPNAALVHSTWSEPIGDGTSESYQVVWALQLENRAWKISGLAMELDAQQPPMIVDFEDYAEMANLFRSQTAVPDASAASASPAARDTMSQTPQPAVKF